jgi:hypothetical protein
VVDGAGGGGSSRRIRLTALTTHEDDQRNDDEVDDGLDELPDAEHDGGLLSDCRLENPADLGEVDAPEEEPDRRQDQVSVELG